MTTATLQKELKRVVRQHKEVGEKLEQLLVLAAEPEENLPYGDWELKPSALKRIERAKKEFAAGKGIVIKNLAELHRFFQKMRHGKY